MSKLVACRTCLATWPVFQEVDYIHSCYDAKEALVAGDISIEEYERRLRDACKVWEEQQ